MKESIVHRYLKWTLTNPGNFSQGQAEKPVKNELWKVTDLKMNMVLSTQFV